MKTAMNIMHIRVNFGASQRLGLIDLTLLTFQFKISNQQMVYCGANFGKNIRSGFMTNLFYKHSFIMCQRSNTGLKGL